MAGPIGFPSETDVVSALQQKNSLSYVAAQLRTSMSRVREIRDRHKSVIVQARLDAGQTLAGVCYQLDLLQYWDRMQEWHKRVLELKRSQAKPLLLEEPDHASSAEHKA